MNGAHHSTGGRKTTRFERTCHNEKMTRKLRDYGAIDVDNSWHESETEETQQPKWLRAPGAGARSLSLTVAGLLLTLVILGRGGSHINSDETSARTAFFSIPILSSHHHHSSPNDPLFYKDQLVDHNAGDADDDAAKWHHRYYASAEHFGGPGHPIFLVVGGEGALDDGLLYPFVNDHLAKKFRAFVLQPEHRFYGVSQPLGVDHDPTNSELARLLTPEQAMSDMIRLALHIQTDELRCSSDRSSRRYCPIVSVGGSYPGFLAAMMRLVRPDAVDVAYASSAPLLLYSQSVDQYAYYEVVTASAERSSEACSAAVRDTLADVVRELDDDVNVNGRVTTATFPDVAARMGVCTDTIPAYIDSNALFRDEAMMIVAYTFADYNMDNYPPTDDTDMARACRIFQDESLSPLERVASFYRGIMSEENVRDRPECFDMMSQLAPGPNATITTADWSGVGDGMDARMWEFQMCSLLIVQTGFSRESMFPPRRWDLDRTAEHCWSRFEVVPQPYRLADEWGFEDLVGMGATRILFTNGLNDMWSAGSHLSNLSDSIVALNFPNGAHHSDLSHEGPTEEDTDDLKDGFVQITNILDGWLKEISNSVNDDN